MTNTAVAPPPNPATRVAGDRLKDSGWKAPGTNRFRSHHVRPAPRAAEANTETTANRGNRTGLSRRRFRLRREPLPTRS